MSMKLTSGFAVRNIKANKHLEIPFIISSSIMLILFNIMISLAENSYVLTRHASLPFFVRFGGVISAIFTFIFVGYANRFLIRKRNKEFALYGVLGLEKKHIRRILFLEHLMNYGIILLFSIGGGYTFGKLAFLGLSRLLKDVSVSVTAYPFSVKASVITAAYVLFLFVFVYCLNIFAIKNASPIELLSRDKKGEGEPKNRIFLMIVGLILLAAGYGIALKIEGVLRSLAYFFLAVLLVLFATYLLFVTLSIFILKLQKKNKAFYYRSKHFLSVSGMLYRMKSGAVGLASVAILSTGVIISLASTLTIYTNINTIVDGTLKKEYEIGFFQDFSPKELEKAKRELADVVENTAGKKAENLSTKVWSMAPVKKSEDGFVPLNYSNDEPFRRLHVIFTTVASYNGEHGENVTLAEDEILFSANDHSKLKKEELLLAGKRYKSKQISNIIPSNIGIEANMVIVANEEILFEMAKHYEDFRLEGGGKKNARINVSVIFDAEEDLANVLPKNNGARRYDLNSKAMMRKDNYELNGGFLFLGIIVGIVFLSGTFLITYYKQVSEGIEDREKYAIMQRVGLPDDLIKKTANVQVVWLFFLPLLVAGLHSLAASKIVYQLLGLFGIHDYMDYASKLGLVGLVFAAIYFVNFKITSNVYYKYVK